MKEFAVLVTFCIFAIQYNRLFVSFGPLLSVSLGPPGGKACTFGISLSSEYFILKDPSGTSKFRLARFTLTEKKRKQMDQAVEMESKWTGRVSENVEQTWRGSATN